MRSINLLVMFAVTIFSALSGAFNLLKRFKHYPNSMPLTTLLVGLSLISFAYAHQLLKPSAKGSTGQRLTLLLYLLNAAFGTLACGILGPPLHHEKHGFGVRPGAEIPQASLPALRSSCSSPYALAVLYLRRQRAALRLTAGQ